MLDDKGNSVNETPAGSGAPKPDQKPSDNDQPKYPPHPLFAQIQKDPTQPPIEVVLLCGWFGTHPGGAATMVRLHPSLANPSEYVDIPVDAIRHHQQTANGAYRVWVVKDAVLNYTWAEEAYALAELVDGPILPRLRKVKSNPIQPTAISTSPCG